MKKVFAMVLVLALAFAMTAAPALATDPPQVYSSVPTEGVPAKGNVGTAEGHRDFAAKAAGVCLYSWRNLIKEDSSAYVKCWQMTETDILADKIQCDFVLQQWNGTDWVTYSTSPNNWMLDTDMFTNSIYRAVAHGYYYRVKTTHKAWLALSYDSEVLYSAYIYVN